LTEEEETIEKEFARRGNLFPLYYIRSARINPSGWKTNVP